MTPSGTIICKSHLGDTSRTSSMMTKDKINHLSNINFTQGNIVLVLGVDSMKTFKDCKLSNTQKQFLQTDLNRMIKKHNTKHNVILIISNELLKTINDLQINLNEYFKEVISYPAVTMIECIDERINGKSIKPNELESYDITINIGADNKIIQSYFPTDLNIITSIGTKGRIRFMSNSTIFSTMCIIVVEANSEIIFNTDNEYINLIIDNNMCLSNTYFNDKHLHTIVELSIDNYDLANNKNISNDILGHYVVKYLINKVST
jgi:hypothetical protein